MRGYTLVELMTVSMIISILAAISFALLSRMRVQANESNGIVALNVMATGYEMYHYHFSEYPQWGPGQRFGSSRELVNFMAGEGYLPHAFTKATYDSATGYLFGITQDYAMEIVEYNPADPTFGATNTYFIILHPYNFQRDTLAIGTNSPIGWIAVRPRKGMSGYDYKTYRLYAPVRGGAID